MRPQTVSNEKILATARRVFIQHGPHASVEAIAGELGLSQPALFKRFGTKKKLMIQALRPPTNVEWIDGAEAGPDDREFPVQLKELAVKIADYLSHHMPLMRAIQMSEISIREIMSEMEEPPPVRALRTMTNWLNACHDKGLIRKTNFRLAALSILGTLQFDTMIGVLAPQEQRTQIREDRNAYVEECVSIFYRGLEPKGDIHE